MRPSSSILFVYIVVACLPLAPTAFTPCVRSAFSQRRPVTAWGRRIMSQDGDSSTSNKGCIGSDSLVFANDPALQASREAAFDRLHTTVRSLSDFEGSEKVRLIRHGQQQYRATSTISLQLVVPINSLLFQVTSRVEPVLVILASSDRVDIQKLEAHLEGGNDDERISVFLTPPDLVEASCGFPPQSVPPLGHAVPKSIRTLVDVRLVDQQQSQSADDSTSILLLGGGGHPLIGCQIAIETLLKLEGTEVADISRANSSSSSSTSSLIAEGENSLPIQQQKEDQQFSDLPKPYFPIAPPDVETAAHVVKYPNEPNPLIPQLITIVGRINGVRRMAQRLVFCDLAPPNYVVGSNTKLDQYDLPWKSGLDGRDMAVQLIAGKTFCKNQGDVDGPAMLKQFKAGQLVFIQGKTNVGNRTSVEHWVEKRSLDIVVWDFQLLDETSTTIPAAAPTRRPPPATITAKVLTPTTISVLPLGNAELRRRELLAASRQPPPPQPAATSCFRLADVFKEPNIQMVDSLESVEIFAHDLSTVSSTERVNGDGPSPILVGVDSEWRPSFMMASPSEAQPVLLLQISIQKLQTVYLMDLQALLRPLLGPSEAMNELEVATSAALSQLFGSTKFLKTGFQLLNDLQRLAGSYPQVDAFRVFHGIVEVSVVAQKALQLSKVRNARQLISSLSRLTKYLVDKPLDKEQQISDWSIRPLSPEQKEYASLDAAVLPMLFEKLLDSSGVSWLTPGKDEPTDLLRLGRWEEDASFLRAISSIRILFLESDSPAAVRKLKAKKIVSDRYIVTQSWAEGTEEPKTPSIPSDGGEGSYTDVSGVLRVPSLLVSLNHSGGSSNGSSASGDVLLAEITGCRLGKSKDSCLAPLLANNQDFPEEAKLEYHHRAGYVEFSDSVALYVTMPLKPGGPPPRGYPNLWLEEGKTLTWFLRDNEWNDGTTRIAHKLLGSSEGVIDGQGEDHSSVVNGNGGELHPAQATTRAILFVRMGRGEFLCCGRCHVAQHVDASSAMTGSKAAKDWGLVELHLKLQDWDVLQNVTDFTSMTTKPTRIERDAVAATRTEDCSADRLAKLVTEGNVVGAMGLALQNVPSSDKSIEVGVTRVLDILARDEASADAMQAMEILKDLTRKYVS